MRCAFLAAAILSAAPATAAAPVIPEGYAYIAVPHVAVAPEASHVYKAIFDARMKADDPAQLAPAVIFAASEVNTLAQNGVPAANRKLAIVFHTTDADMAVMDDAHYRARYHVNNPNLRVLSELRKEGVELFVCSQQLAADRADLKAISPDVALASDGLIVLMTYQNKGYALISY